MMDRPQAWLQKNVGLENFKGGFERAQSLIKPLAIKLQERCQVVTIAGTNGKGQVAHELSFLLEQQGLSVARWSSPHILNVGERFYFKGLELSHEQLLASFEKHRPLLEHGPSYYEFLFAIFCYEALERELDYLILEVGLGGRLDAVNIFDADYCAITSISLDHQDILGSDLKKILQEKWGVTRPNKSCLTCLHQPELRELSQSWSEEQKTPRFDLFEEQIVSLSMDYFQRNRLLAIALSQLTQGLAFEQVKTNLINSPEELNFSFPATKGRFEEMTRGALRFIFIGAHNSDGLKNMTDSLLKKLAKEEFVFDEVWFSFSQRRTEELKEFLWALRPLNQLTQTWRYCEFEHPKALRLSEGDKTSWRSWSQVLLPPIQTRSLSAVVSERPQQGTILVTGSYYFIGEVQKLL